MFLSLTSSLLLLAGSTGGAGAGGGAWESFKHFYNDWFNIGGFEAWKFVNLAIFVAFIAGIMPLDLIASLANAGTLCAFIAVALCTLVMRRRAPDQKRGFRTPAVWLVAPVAILGCLYLFTSLQAITQHSFIVWNALGLVVYFLYGIGRSRAS